MWIDASIDWHIIKNLAIHSLLRSIYCPARCVFMCNPETEQNNADARVALSRGKNMASSKEIFYPMYHFTSHDIMHTVCLVCYLYFICGFWCLGDWERVGAVGSITHGHTHTPKKICAEGGCFERYVCLCTFMYPNVWHVATFSPPPIRASMHSVAHTTAAVKRHYDERRCIAPLGGTHRGTGHMCQRSRWTRPALPERPERLPEKLRAWQTN